MPVNTQHADYSRMLPKWSRCRDVAAGQDAVHGGGETYLPKLKDQAPDDYKSYKLRTTFYNATWRTIAGLVGMVFRKPPKIEVPGAIDELLEDIDAAGQPFQLFLQTVTEEALEQGRVGVLVDYPVAKPGLTKADAKLQKLRPTMQLYNTFAIINWRAKRVDNRTVLTLVVLKECEEVQVPGDEFVVKEEDRWRVLDLTQLPANPGDSTPSTPVYRQRLYKMKAGQNAKSPVIAFEQIGEDIHPTMNAKPLAFIPFVIMGTDDVSADIDEPPLIDLVDLNLSHYRTSADYAHGCHFTGLPTLFLAGFKRENPGDKVYIGSEAAIIASNPDAKASFVEFTGQGLGALEKKLDREEQQMAILGARMLEPQRKAVEAADTASIHRKGEESMLSSIAQAISLGATQALKWFTEWAGADPANVVVELNRDFYPAPMTAQMLSALLAGWQQGAPGLSDQGLFDLLKKGEIVSPEVTLEDEQTRVAERQQQLADQAAALQGTMDIPGGAAVDRTPKAE